jgi:pimeloyl-ACP methyl ester carboxylesterase
MRNSARRGTFTEDDREKYVAAWSQPGALSAMIGWYRAMFKAVEPGTRRRYARRIQMPTLILWGEQDIALGVELAEESVNWLENGRLIRYPDNTHWIVDELADEVAAQLKAHFGG